MLNRKIELLFTMLRLGQQSYYFIQSPNIFVKNNTEEVKVFRFFCSCMKPLFFDKTVFRKPHCTC